VDDVELVVHVDPPVEHKAYLHRSGRTARAGAAGTVVTLTLPEQRRDVKDILRKAQIAVGLEDVTPAIVAELVGERAPKVKYVPAPAQPQGAPKAKSGQGRGNAQAAGRGRGGRGAGAQGQGAGAQRDQAQPRQRGAGQGQSRRTAQVYSTTSGAPAAAQGRSRSGSRRASRPQGN
jgi:superfamily II DNA/RNA helicase